MLISFRLFCWFCIQTGKKKSDFHRVGKVWQRCRFLVTSTRTAALFNSRLFTGCKVRLAGSFSRLFNVADNDDNKNQLKEVETVGQKSAARSQQHQQQKQQQQQQQQQQGGGFRCCHCDNSRCDLIAINDISCPKCLKSEKKWAGLAWIINRVVVILIWSIITFKKSKINDVNNIN